MDRIANIHILTKRLIVMTALSVLLFSGVFALSFQKGLFRKLLVMWSAVPQNQAVKRAMSLASKSNV